MAGMIRIAIPIFRSRVSPVLDSCTSVLLVDVEKNRAMERKEIYLDELSLTERVTIIHKSKVTTVICGGISDILQNMLRSADIALITGIAGEVDQVVAAYLAKALDEPRFHMPGFHAEQ
jgi:predicted Fe-Mo cluster-binding NifX family protein